MDSKKGRGLIGKIFRAQQSAFRLSDRFTVAERLANLRKLKAALKAWAPRLAEAVRLDFGKHAFEFQATETAPCLAEIDYAVRHLKSWLRPEKAAAPLEFFGTRGLVRYEPKGIVLILSPWNYPLFLSLPPLAAALAAGNRVMLRPSSKVPRFSRALKAMLDSCFDESEVAVVLGGHDVGDALLKLPFDHIFFTGSTAVGRKIMAAASRHLATVTLELGGKSPAVVDSTADIAWAGRSLAWGKFVNAGQTCVAPDYVLVDVKRERELLEALKKSVVEFYGPDEKSREACKDFCRLVDAPALARLKSALDQTLAAGARLEMGGRFNARTRYLAPTILSGVKPGMAVMKQEIFGPLLPVITYDDPEQALDFLRRQDKPLASYIYSRDKKFVEKILSGTSAGGTVVNNTLIHLANPNLPYGGVGASGMGNYHGYAGFQAFSHARPVLSQGRPRLSGFFHPPYDGWVKKTVSRILGLLH